MVVFSLFAPQSGFVYNGHSIAAFNNNYLLDHIQSYGVMFTTWWRLPFLNDWQCYLWLVWHFRLWGLNAVTRVHLLSISPCIELTKPIDHFQKSRHAPRAREEISYMPPHAAGWEHVSNQSLRMSGCSRIWVFQRREWWILEFVQIACWKWFTMFCFVWLMGMFVYFSKPTFHIAIESVQI